MNPAEIKPRRLALDLKQSELAELANCARQTVGEIERGQSGGSDLVLARIDRALTKLESNNESK